MCVEGGKQKAKEGTLGVANAQGQVKEVSPPEQGERRRGQGKGKQGVEPRTVPGTEQLLVK